MNVSCCFNWKQKAAMKPLHVENKGGGGIAGNFNKVEKLSKCGPNVHPGSWRTCGDTWGQGLSLGRSLAHSHTRPLLKAAHRCELLLRYCDARGPHWLALSCGRACLAYDHTAPRAAPTWQ